MLPLLQQLQDNHADIVGFIEDPVRTTPTPSPAPSKRFSGCISLSPSFFCTSLRLEHNERGPVVPWPCLISSLTMTPVVPRPCPIDSPQDGDLISQDGGVVCVQVIYEDLESWCAIRSMFAIPIIMQGKPIKEVQMLSRECGT